uniref:Mitochondrial import inner membrane translocase subunit TIM50 n=1 Tax=Ananas comosus var. bracteatus TaxID=296719 RepID=A0A6V7QJY6_ANACO|nr:unnamed protein product [Ananas comosus var. bracteatus]
MVSKTPTKPAKISPKSKPRHHRTPKPVCRHHHRRCAKPSPLKSFAVSIDRSIRSCRRRLVKLFANLAIFGTPNRHKNGFLAAGSHHHPPRHPRLSKLSSSAGCGSSGVITGFRRLKSTPEKHPSPPAAAAAAAANGNNRKPLPPLSCPAKKTIFLDLDETLVHSKTDPAPSITTSPSDRRSTARPSPSTCSSAPESTNSSAKRRRISSSKLGGKFVKDLSAVGRELDRVVIVDDNPNTYIFQPENAVPMSPFVDNLADRELWKLRKFLQVANTHEDMKEAIKYYLANFRDRK